MTDFPVISSQKFVFYNDCSQICEKKDMKELLEEAYEEFASIAGGTWDSKVKKVALKDLYGRLGNASYSLDNMIFERLGMSADEAMDMLDRDDILP